MIPVAHRSGALTGRRHDNLSLFAPPFRVCVCDKMFGQMGAIKLGAYTGSKNQETFFLV